MSIRQMNKVWELELDRRDQAILLALADHADDDGENVFPSVLRLVYKTGYEETQVKTLLKRLRDKLGLIELVERGGGRGKPNRYRLRLDKGVEKQPFSEWLAERKKGSETDSEKGQSETENRQNEPQKGSVASAPEPSVHENRQVVEPSEEPSVSTEGTHSNESVEQNTRALTESGENRTPQQELTDRLYDKLYQQYDIKLSGPQFGFHIKRFSEIREKLNATDSECERVLAHMVAVYPKAPKVDAWSALQDIRLGRDDGSAWKGKTQDGSYYQHKQDNADKPRKPQWYMAFYGGSPDYYQSLIDEGYGHDDILSEALSAAV